jgi:hypothetical protein
MQSIFKRSLVRDINMLSDFCHLIESGTTAICSMDDICLTKDPVTSPERAMDKLTEVETAKELMTEATRWSVMKWLREKRHVRDTADRANAALDQWSDSLRKKWPADLRDAYDALSAERSSPQSGTLRSVPHNGAAHLAIAKKIKEADDEAYRARTEAEKTFDEAEKKLSTAMAREGCLKAIRSWELKEKAIRNAQQLAGR